MNYKLLEHVTALLTAAQIPAGEEYPGLERPEIHSPCAVVGLRELDAEGWTARFRVRVFSPRLLGGWCCQMWAAWTVRALTDAGLQCRTEEMEYNSGCDCFCVTVEAAMAVLPAADGWDPGRRWGIRRDGVVQQGVVSFKAERDLQRRLVGTHWKNEPVGISPGSGGWRLELVQQLEEEELKEAMAGAEPFVLTVNDGGGGHRYTGCCWNEMIWEYTQGGARLTRRGFALAQEEE